MRFYARFLVTAVIGRDVAASAGGVSFHHCPITQFGCLALLENAAAMFVSTPSVCETAALSMDPALILYMERMLSEKKASAVVTLSCGVFGCVSFGK